MRKPILILATDTKQNLKKVKELCNTLAFNPIGYMQGAIVCHPPLYALKGVFNLDSSNVNILSRNNSEIYVPVELKENISMITLTYTTPNIRNFNSLKKKVKKVEF